jgi:hypothetical protein
MRRRSAIAGSSQTPRRLVTICALLALFLQSFAIQTHIHRLVPANRADVTQTANLPGPAPLKAQDPLDQGGCRLCQELAHSGFFVGPSATALWTGLTFVVAAFIVLPVAAVLAPPPFAWQSRAPPR